MGGIVLATVSSCSGVLPQQNSGTPATPPNEALPDAPTTTAAGSEGDIVKSGAWLGIRRRPASGSSWCCHLLGIHL
jgi:hypothetical protein